MKHTLAVTMSEDTYDQIKLLAAGFNQTPANVVKFLIAQRYNSLMANNENFAAFVDNQKSVQMSLFK